MTKEALKLALEALEMFCEHGAILRPIETRDAIKAVLAQPQRKPLSDEEIYSLADSLEIWNEEDEEWILDPNTFARAIEAAHGIKGEA